MFRGMKCGRLVVAGVALIGFAAAGCSDGTEREPDRAPELVGLRGHDLFVNGHPAAQRQAVAWEAEGRVEDARLLRQIADRPLAVWLSDSPEPARAQALDVVTRAHESGQMPVLVAYNVPARDCDGYSAGGTESDQQYREWINAVAEGLGDRPATLILEPDAVAHALDGCLDDDGRSRLELLRWAVGVLKASGSVRVYLDAGNPGWIRDVPALADALRTAGIDEADGFALNVSNFVSTAENIEYGTRLSAALGGTPFVIDTSRNGNGPYGSGDYDGAPAWCNPPGRALGQPPTTVDTGSDLVDALLWIKIPGESDGACRPGEPPAGTWWLDYALGLARNATS